MDICYDWTNSTRSTIQLNKIQSVYLGNIYSQTDLNSFLVYTEDNYKEISF